MRAAAIYGPGCSARDLRPFQAGLNLSWLDGFPASPDDCDVILIFGGDGTIHRYLSQLVALGRPVLVVPSGSGNDFARSLGLGSCRDALRAWQTFCSTRSNLRTIDLGLITPLAAPDATPKYFACVAGIGLDAEVARRANAMPRWLRAHGGYALGLAPTLFRFAPAQTKIRIPHGEHWITHSHYPILLAAFANTPYYGHGMKIAPRAEMDDGLLDACIISSLNAFKLFCLFPTVYFGRHLAIKEVDYFQTRAARLDPEFPLDVYADGEFVCRTPVEIGIQPGALQAIVSQPQSGDII